MRVIAATNKDLNKLVREGKFREDLYYRLNVVHIYIPPLRTRREDIPPLIEYFRNKFNRKYNCSKTISEKLINILQSMPWKGNVRELENTIERLIVTSKSDFITEKELEIVMDVNTQNVNSLTLNEVIETYEREILMCAKREYKSTRKIAKMLGVSQSTIVRKLKKYGINE